MFSILVQVCIYRNKNWKNINLQLKLKKYKFIETKIRKINL